MSDDFLEFIQKGGPAALLAVLVLDSPKSELRFKAERLSEGVPPDSQLAFGWDPNTEELILTVVPE